tara:strand:+ start:27069 stop:27743 length:675 start_codon:yes stop_codon:yes gene_type:complete
MDKGRERRVQSQDILILIKLISLRRKQLSIPFNVSYSPYHIPNGLEGWEPKKNFETEEEANRSILEKFTVRGLADVSGVSKSAVNISINRSVDSGLAIYDRKSGLPRANEKALYEFIVYGLKYVFPVKAAEITRGIPTSFGAPALSKEIKSAGDYIYVWPDARGKEKGQSLEPLYKSVPFAVKHDLFLYEVMALIDAVRIGSPREANLAKEILSERLLNYETDI